MTAKKIDVVSIGGATRDIFFRTSDARLIPEPEAKRGMLVAFEHGHKIIPEEVYISQGGGAYNSSSCFARLGLEASALVSLGNDGSGHRIKRLLGERGVDTELVHFHAHVATAIAVIVAVERDHIVFLYRGANDHLEFSDLKSKIDARWLYVTSLTGRGAQLLPEIVDYVHAKNAKLAFNPGSLQLQSGYEGLKNMLAVTEVLLLNLEEAGRLAASYSSEIDITDRNVLLETIYRMGPKRVVITEGKVGSCCLDEAGMHFHDAHQVATHDTTGAGDAYGATLVSGLIHGFSIERAMCLSSANSASVVTRMGATEGLLELRELEQISDRAA